MTPQSPARRVHRWWRFPWIAALAALLLALFGKGLVAHLAGNLGMVRLAQALALEGALPRGGYPVYGAVDREALRSAQDALRWANSHRSALSLRWALGRAHLAAGEAASALEAMQPFMENAPANPLLCSDVLLAVSLAGQPADVLALYDRWQDALPRTRAVSDTLALAYLDAARPYVEIGSQIGAAPLLEAALAFRPYDLYALYALGGGHPTPESAARFPVDALRAANVRLVEYLAAAIAALYTESVWDRGLTARAASYLVWQQPGAPGVETLLVELARRDPADAAWPYLLGQWRHRRGELDLARAHYLEALALAPDEPEVLLHLGLVCQAQGDLEAAATYLWRYRELAPDDAPAAERLASVLEALGDARTASLRREFDKTLDDGAQIAAALDTPVEGIRLGPNLLRQGDFEAIAARMPAGWAVSDYTRVGDPPVLAAACEAGADSLLPSQGSASARLDGLWMDEGSPAMCGLVTMDEEKGAYLLTLAPRRLYLVSGLYRTVGQGTRASVDLSSQAGGLFGQSLPPTGGGWRRFAILTCSGDAQARAMSVGLRLRSAGTVWYDDIAVREVRGLASAPPCETALLSPR